MKIHATTPRLLLRDLLPTDAAGMFALDSDPEVHRWLGNKPIKTMEEAENTIALVRQQYLDNGIGRWAVVDRATDEFIGWAGLKHEQSRWADTRYYDLGYRLRTKYWGRGIATEAAVAALRHGFANMALQEINATAHIGNVASNRILSKIGFRLAGKVDYEGIECNWYSILQSEWEGSSR